MYTAKQKRSSFAFFLGAAGRITFMLALCVLLGADDARAMEDELPAGEKVFADYIQACGGQDAFDKIESRVTKSTLDMPAQGLHLALTVYAAKPNKNYMEIESAAFGRIVKGCDGDVVWEDSPLTGTVVKEGAEKEMMLREMILDKFVYWQSIYETVECVARETVGDRDCYKVTALPHAAASETAEKPSPQTLYFDTGSGLLVRMIATIPTAGGDIPMDVSLGDYKEVDGILLPHKLITKLLGQERMGTVLSVMHNLKLDKNLFDLPEEIQKLADKNASE